MISLNNIFDVALSLLAALSVLSIHEYFHALIAYKLGDPTAKSLGRLTLNPIKHIDPIGAVCLVLFHFGWARPVPINARYFKKPKRDFALTALAGPASNLIVAFFSAPIYLLLLEALWASVAPDTVLWRFLYYIVSFFATFISINVGIAIFNLIPIPPLDGSRILNVILPPKAYFGIMKYERYIYFGLIGWLALGDIVASLFLSIPFVAASPVLSFIAGLFSLSDILSTLFGFVVDGILAFWRLFI